MSTRQPWCVLLFSSIGVLSFKESCWELHKGDLYWSCQVLFCPEAWFHVAWYVYIRVAAFARNSAQWLLLIARVELKGLTQAQLVLDLSKRRDFLTSILLELKRRNFNARTRRGCSCHNQTCSSYFRVDWNVFFVVRWWFRYKFMMSLFVRIKILYISFCARPAREQPLP